MNDTSKSVQKISPKNNDIQPKLRSRDPQVLHAVEFPQFPAKKPVSLGCRRKMSPQKTGFEAKDLGVSED
jgi:hypothetical protein